MKTGQMNNAITEMVNATRKMEMLIQEVSRMNPALAHEFVKNMDTVKNAQTFISGEIKEALHLEKKGA